MHRIFILSPANTNGKRAAILMSDRADFDLAMRLRSHDGAPLWQVFSFLSGLYFRGKFTYSKHFGRAPDDIAAQYVITSNAGLMNCDESISVARLKDFGQVPIDLRESRYTRPLRKSVNTLGRSLPANCDVVLLGSIATNKYTDILIQSFGERLLFPRDFIGRGDMSRGGLLLRAVKADSELEYISLTAAESRRGPRPPKLPKEGIVVDHTGAARLNHLGSGGTSTGEAGP